MIGINICLITENSAGVYHINDFLQHIAHQLPNLTTLIGLNHKTVIEGLTEILNCGDYIDAHNRLFNDFRARDDFLEVLTTETHPIVFIVPHKLFGAKQGFTAKEMEWLLQNPERMKNIYFVFGAYKIYSKKMVLSAVVKPNQLDKYVGHLTTRIFKQLQAGLELPKIESNDEKEQDEIKILTKKLKKIHLQPFQKPSKNSQSLKVIDLDEEIQMHYILNLLSLVWM